MVTFSLGTFRKVTKHEQRNVGDVTQHTNTPETETQATKTLKICFRINFNKEKRKTTFKSRYLQPTPVKLISYLHYIC